MGLQVITGHTMSGPSPAPERGILGREAESLSCRCLLMETLSVSIHWAHPKTGVELVLPHFVTNGHAALGVPQGPVPWATIDSCDT